MSDDRIEVTFECQYCRGTALALPADRRRILPEQQLSVEPGEC